MDNINKNTPKHDRRTILIDEEKNKRNLQKEKVFRDSVYGMSPGIPIIKYLLDNKTYSKIQIGFGEINYCVDNFRFPPQHPQKGIVYACPDYESDFYIPLSNFHIYTLQLKQSAFVEMCAHLGAKEVFLIEERHNGEEIDVNTDLDDIPTKSGNVSASAKAKYSSSNYYSGKLSYSFSKPKKFNVVPYDSKWIESEPTWRTLQNLRLNNNIEEFNAELNYKDEMGINTDLSAKINKLGLNIGGEFNEFKKVERTYKVVFWN